MTRILSSTSLKASCGANGACRSARSPEQLRLELIAGGTSTSDRLLAATEDVGDCPNETLDVAAVVMVFTLRKPRIQGHLSRVFVKLQPKSEQPSPRCFARNRAGCKAIVAQFVTHHTRALKRPKGWPARGPIQTCCTPRHRHHQGRPYWTHRCTSSCLQARPAGSHMRALPPTRVSDICLMNCPPACVLYVSVTDCQCMRMPHDC